MNGNERLTDGILRLKVANDIVDATSNLLDTDVRTEVTTYGDTLLHNPDDFESSSARIRRYALIQTADFVVRSLDTDVTGAIRPDSRRRELVGHNILTSDHLNYGLMDIRTSIKGLTRVMNLTMSNGEVARIRGIAIDHFGDVFATSQLRMPTSEFEKFAYTAISDEHFLVLNPILSGRAPLDMRPEDAMETIKKSVEASGNEVDVPLFMNLLVEHYVARKEANEFGEVVNGGPQQMSIDEMKRLRDFLTGDESAVSVYDSDAA